MGDAEIRPEFEVDKLFAGDDTTTVFLFPPSPAYPQGIWVELKTELDYGEDLSVTAALFKGMSYSDQRATLEAAETMGTTTVITDIATQKRVKLALWIHDWNLPGRDGKTVKWPARPLDRFGVINGLSKKVGEWLEARVDEIIAQYEGVKRASADDPEAEKVPLALLRGGEEPAQT